MPDTATNTASQLAQHLCAAVRELAEPHPLVREGVVTVSIGAAAITPTTDDHVDRLFERTTPPGT